MTRKISNMTGDQLRRKREVLDWSQEKLAERLGVTKLTVLRYENGQRDIPIAVELALKQIERENLR